MTFRAQKMDATLAQARERLQTADRKVHELVKNLRGLDDQQSRINALGRLQEALQELQTLGGQDPFSGNKLKKNDYSESLARIKNEKDEHNAVVIKLKDELKQARVDAAKINEEYEQLSRKFKEEEQQRRQKALEAYRREVKEKGFQLRKDDIYYRSMDLQWGGDRADNGRLRRTSLFVLLFTLLLSIGISNLILPQEEKEVTELPPRLAKLLVEREKKQQPKEEPQQRAEQLKTSKQAPAPLNKEQSRARERAKQTGLLAMGDTFESLKQNAFEAKLASQDDITVAGRQSSATRNTIVTSAVSGTSGGIQTAGLSRATGASGLQGRSTSRVSSGLADSVAANANRRVVGSGKASRTDEEIQIVFDRNKSALYRLYNRELRINPTLQGKVVLKLTIAPTGVVTMCKVISSSLKAPGLERKIAQRVKLFNFGSKKVSSVTITYPIDFFPA